MSKTSQRRQSAYRDGYALGRHLKDCGFRWNRGGLAHAFDDGYQQGKRDRAAALLELDRRRWYNRVLEWLCRRVVA